MQSGQRVLPDYKECRSADSVHASQRALQHAILRGDKKF
jgi:hypothetical protein